MYTDFFKLKIKPFEMAPDPRFLFFSETHQEAFAYLQYGIIDQKGFLVLTGDIGTGKTTLLHALIKELEQNIKVAYITNPAMEKREFLSYIANSFGLERPKSKVDFLEDLSQLLHHYNRQDKRPVLIIDEAHKLTPELLEEVRLLSNIETPEKKLLTIFLVGQIEFLDLINSDECRALKQRISLRYHLDVLTEEETREYIRHRLAISSFNGFGASIFTDDAVKEIYRFSKGYPRVINIICDHALVSAFARGKHKVGKDIIKECAADLDMKIPKKGRSIRVSSSPVKFLSKLNINRKTLLWTSGLTFLAIGFYLLYSSGIFHKLFAAILHTFFKKGPSVG